MESSAVSLSTSAIKIPHSQTNKVRKSAGAGSPRYDFANALSIGIKSSLTTACKSLGAPVRVCKPAPTVEQNAPTMITHLLGQARTATTNCLLILSPNLSLSSEPWTQAARKMTFDKSRTNKSIFYKKVYLIIQITEVVKIAAIVPRGILRLGSRRSPLRFEPAIIPSRQDKTVCSSYFYKSY